MKKILLSLKVIYWAFIIINLVFALVIEFFLIDETGGDLATNANLEFIIQSIATLLTLGSVFLALRFFKFAPIEKKLREQPLEQYLNMSIVRISFLQGPFLLNLVSYMLFVNSSFVWLALIGAIGFFFIYPNENRFLNETGYVEQ